MIDKIYLSLKHKISILVQDGYWSLQPGDMIVLQKIGVRTIIENYTNVTAKVNTDSYLLIGFEYETFKDISKALNEGDTEKHMVWNECNSVDTEIGITLPAPYYGSISRNYANIIEATKNNLPLLSNYHTSLMFDDVFEDVSLKYNRNEKIKFLFNQNKCGG